ncbi:hypothetical protein QBC43DRAFT_109304 [Cladorrhinum sp. PSN259]|nr:hypothetical protein QBC43DRAFT_109304 [Cladorrhinum sp. PSN259]
MKRYLYEPVPIEDAEVRQLPVVHLLKPGRHSKDFWIKRLPKKLKDRLVWDQNVQGDVIGWGVRINEEVNRGLVHLAFFVLSLVLVVGVGIYIKLTGKWDNWENQATAWGFGGFVVALLAFWDYLVINSF